MQRVKNGIFDKVFKLIFYCWNLLAWKWPSRSSYDEISENSISDFNGKNRYSGTQKSQTFNKKKYRSNNCVCHEKEINDLWLEFL